MTVLIVDDDEDIRESMQDVLRDLGVQAVVAVNGREGLALAQKLSPRPKVILLDLMMPVMNGWQFLDALQREPELSRIPVVVMTAAVEAHLPKGAAVRLLRKPVAYDELISALAAHVPLRAATL